MRAAWAWCAVVAVRENLGVSGEAGVGDKDKTEAHCSGEGADDVEPDATRAAILEGLKGAPAKRAAFALMQPRHCPNGVLPAHIGAQTPKRQGGEVDLVRHALIMRAALCTSTSMMRRRVLTTWPDD